MSTAQLSEAIESTGAMASRLYALKQDTSDVDAQLDLLVAEFDSRN